MGQGRGGGTQRRACACTRDCLKHKAKSPSFEGLSIYGVLTVDIKITQRQAEILHRLIAHHIPPTSSVAAEFVCLLFDIERQFEQHGIEIPQTMAFKTKIEIKRPYSFGPMVHWGERLAIQEDE